MRGGTWLISTFLLYLGVACSPPPQAPPPEVEALAEGARWVGAQSEVVLGKPIDMRLWVVTDIRKGALDPGLFGPGSILTRLEGPRLENARLEPTGEAELDLRGQRLFCSRPYRLTWLRLGEQTLLPFEIQLEDRNAKLATQSLDFEVAGVLTEKDAKDAEIPTALFQDAPTSHRLLYLFLGILLMAVLIGWWLQHRLRGKMHDVDLGPQLSAIEEARQRLREVETAWKGQQLDGESLVVAVSAVLRTYLQKGLGFHSLTHTTEEFLDELRSTELVPMTVQTPLAAFLQQCDLIKFAAQGSDAELSRSLLAMTHALLDDAERIEVAQSRTLSAPDSTAEVQSREEVVQRG